MTTPRIGPRQFAGFRAALGVYLALHFAGLAPYAAELFGSQGTLPDPRLNFTYGLLPNPLEHALSPAQTRGFVLALVALAVLFAAGVARRAGAVLLWYGWACLFNRNNLISNPSLPYVGLILLLSALVPAGEGWTPGARTPRAGWEFPPGVYWAAWAPLAIGYTFSGLHKLGSPSWVDGEALRLLADNPLARPGPLRALLLALPDPVLHGMTWFALAGEILFLPLSLHRVTRLAAWSWLLGMHLGILGVIAFADLTAGMVLAHWFVWDPRWVGDLRGWRARWRRARAAREG